MIEERLEYTLTNMGYQKITSNAKGIYLFYHTEGSDLSVVSIIRDTGGNELTKAQYEHILEQIKNNFRNSYPHRMRLLSLILTASPERAKHLCTDNEEDSHWIIDLSTKRLMIYETQSNEFATFRSDIELLLDEEFRQNGSGSNSKEDYDTADYSRYGSTQGYEIKQDRNTVSGYGAPHDYEARSGYDSSQGYGAPHDYETSSGYGPSQGYRAPHDYDTRSGHRTAQGYGTIQDNIRPRYKVFTLINTIIIVVNVIAFFILHYAPVLGGENGMLAQGALSWYFVKEEGEYYRILTSMFMHSDWSHLFNNMLVLLVVGDNLERAAGKLKYILIYFGTGIIAGITSISYNMWKEAGQYVAQSSVFSIGASGAIFGIVGAMLFIVIINKGRLEDISTRQMILFVIFSLYGGIVNTQIDQAAHVGGFLAGMLLAALFYRKPLKKVAEEQP